MVDTRFYKNNGPFTLEQVAEICGVTLVDETKSAVLVYDLASMEKAKEGDICFFFDKKAKKQASEMKATACITTEELKDLVPSSVIALIGTNPKLASLKFNEAMYGMSTPQSSIAMSAHIHESAMIGQNCFIGENVVIEEGVIIGDNCIIEANVVIEHHCEIGHDCRIGVGVHIAYSLIGHHCRIFSGARLGQDGFGFMMLNGQHHRIPQLGRLIVGNDVEIGCNACVDRGALDDTVVGDGCRIDNLVQIAHNDVLGRGCVIVSQVGIAGSTHLGDYVVLGGQVGVADHLTIGSGTQVAAQSGVMSNLDAGSVVMGYPTVPVKQFMRQALYLSKAVKK